MTRQELYDFVVQLLGGYQMDSTLFDTYLDIAQMEIEGLRPWRQLLTEDATQSISASDTFQSGKTIPADFLMYSSIVLVNSQNNSIVAQEVPIESKYTYKDVLGKFFTDLTFMLVYFCGPIREQFIVHQFYTKRAPLVSANNIWVFPAAYHKALGLRVASMWREEVDYDTISGDQAIAQEKAYARILDAMTKWDSNLQLNDQSGIDPFGTNQIGQEAGRLPSSQY